MSKSLLVKLLLLCSVGHTAVLPIIHIIGGLAYSFRILGLICITLLTVQCFPKSKPKYYFALLGLLVLCIVNILLTDTGITFDLFLSVFSVFSLLFLTIISSNIRVDNSLRKSIYQLSLLGTIVLTIHSFAPYSHFTGQFESIYLTYGFDNSNFAGITTFLLYCAVLIAANYKKKVILIFTLAIAGWLLYLILLTNCRSAFVAAILVPFAMILFGRYRLPNILLYLACAIPFIFVPFYLNFVDNATENVEIMGKGVASGREDVYQDYLERLEEDYQYVIGTFHSDPFTNAHNGPLSYFVSLGALGTVFAFFIIIDKLRRYNNQAASVNAKCAIFVILSVFIESCGEASLFLGGFPGIVYFFIFFVIGASDTKKLSLAKTTR